MGKVLDILSGWTVKRFTISQWIVSWLVTAVLIGSVQWKFLAPRQPAIYSWRPNVLNVQPLNKTWQAILVMHLDTLMSTSDEDHTMWDPLGVRHANCHPRLDNLSRPVFHHQPRLLYTIATCIFKLHLNHIKTVNGWSGLELSLSK